MQISEQGLAFIRQFEKFEPKAYPDPGTGGSPWTIGYGHTRGVRPGMTCTPEEAEQWLLEDTGDAVRAIQDYVRVPLTQGQFDALVSFVFNVGVNHFNTSTLLRKINAGDMEGAANEFIRWNRAGGHEMAGLTRRREGEAAIFRSDV